MSQPFILINHITYSVSEKPIFTGLSLALAKEKIGLIGCNGVGKSTLLKLIMSELTPESGSISISGILGYCPQQFVCDGTDSIATLLGIQEKIDALAEIKKGGINEECYNKIGDDWLLEDHAHQHLSLFGLGHLALDQALSSISAGEKTRLYLAKTFWVNPDFILLDEPTNNLDSASRDLLYQVTAKWQKGLLVVSHDRQLLNLMDQIIELTAKGVNTYGGNFDHYQRQKSVMELAAERELLDAKNNLTRVKFSSQVSRERLQQRQSYGRNQYHSGKIDKMLADTRKWQSERTQSRLLVQSEAAVKKAEQQLKIAQAKVELSQEIDIELPKTAVPNKKIIVSAKDLRFSYTPSKILINHFNLDIIGPERIALIGQNGSGKTTLVKLILGQLKPSHGDIYVGTDRISYLEQNTTLLNLDLTLLDNFLLLNQDANLKEAHAALAKFLFKNTTALKITRDLSGGETLRAQLACTLMSKRPPQLLILDEPTNHLDIESIESLESALKNYAGAMIVISHDYTFLQHIHIQRSISAPFNA